MVPENERENVNQRYAAFVEANRAAGIKVDMSLGKHVRFFAIPEQWSVPVKQDGHYVGRKRFTVYPVMMHGATGKRHVIGWVDDFRKAERFIEKNRKEWEE